MAGWRWTIAAILGAAAAGCGSQGTSGGAPSDAGGGAADAGVIADGGEGADCGSLAWPTSACAACTSANCCSFEALCLTLPSCAPLNTCWEGCGGDAGCTTACGTTYVDAISNYNAILTCQFNECPTVCGP